MRKLLIIAFMALATVAQAQQKRVYFFSDFVDTKITYKGGAHYRVKANYDIANMKMMYMQGDELMELTSPQLVDTIYTDGYAWVYKDRRFCQVVNTDGGHRVLVGWNLVKVHQGYKGVYGISQVPARKVELSGDFGMGNIAGENGGMYNGSFGTNDEDDSGRNLDVWKEKNRSTYYFEKDGREYSLRGLKSVYKAFPDKKALIKQFVREHKLDPMRAEDFLQIIDFILK
ncbi:MAG: hypothetical protein IJR71_02800 [Prevotella sp.]|nr:hypothetical protein [Prevotella sp.]